MRVAVLVISTAVLLGGCANMFSGTDTLAVRPLTAGTMMEFAAPAPKVAAATTATVQALGLTLNGSTTEETSTVINFSKGMTAFSWGEVGRIVVTPAGDAAARVYVDTEKRSTYQITGTNEAQFSKQIFDGIKVQLAK